MAGEDTGSDDAPRRFRPRPRRKKKKNLHVIDVSGIQVVAPPEKPCVPRPVAAVAASEKAPAKTSVANYNDMETVLPNLQQNDINSSEDGSLFSLDMDDPLLSNAAKTNTTTSPTNSEPNQPQPPMQSRMVSTELSNLATSNDNEKNHGLTIEEPNFPQQPPALAANADGDTRLSPPTPWWNKVESTRDLEHWVMENLDEIICKKEEQEVMQRLDGMILKREEQDVMQKLLLKVHESEDAEFAASYKSRVRNMIKVGEKGDGMADGEMCDAWGLVQKRKKSPVATDHATGTNKSVIMDVECLEIKTGRQKIPKWMPVEADSGERERIFTRQEFWESVVKAGMYKREFRNTYFHQSFTAKILESHPDDPDCYMLQASGTREQLADLSDLVQSFVRFKIADINLEHLVTDDHSLRLNVTVRLKETLGIKIGWYIAQESKKRSVPGIWLRSVDCNGALAEALGGNAVACQKGLVILALNGQDLWYPEQLVNILGERKKAKEAQVLLTLCFSKYADLSAMPDYLKRTLKFGNGSLFNEKTLANILQQQQRKEILWSREEPQEDQRYLFDSSDDDGESFTSPHVLQEKHTVSFPELGTSNPTAPLPYGQPRKLAASSTSRLARYEAFEEKYKQLVPLEFKNTKIHQKKIFSTMWSAHKQLFGPNADCNDKCMCLEKLPNLVANVISDHADAPGTALEGNLERTSSGLIEYFVPRFVGLLKSEYPSESPSQLIGRIVAMWPHHQSSRMYGLRCTRRCNCVDEWDQLFGKGDESKIQSWIHSFKSSRKRTRPVKSNSQDYKPAASKKPKSAAVNAVDSHASMSASSRPAVDVSLTHPSKSNELKPLRGRLPPTMEHRQKKNDVHSERSIVRGPFEVVFDTSRPMGGFFATRQGVDYVTGCRLISMFPYGSIAKDKRIHPGCLVLAVIMGERLLDVSGHDDIRQHYQNAKRAKRDLRLRFENKGIHGFEDSEENWTSAGNWIGPSMVGWAGGAIDESDRFHRSHEAIQTKGDAAGTVPGRGLVEAVRSHSSKEVIEELVAGYPRDRFELEGVLGGQCKIARQQLDTLKASMCDGGDADASTIHQIQDCTAKYFALEIYMNSIREIEKAVTLKGWNVVEFRLNHLELQKSMIHQFSGFNAVVSGEIRTENPEFGLGVIPEKRLASVISYRDSDRQWHSHSNYLFTSENRLLLFDILIGNTRNSFCFSFDDVERNSPPSHTWFSMRKDLPNVGKLEITCRRRPADKNYVLRKKEEAVKELIRQVEMIKQFNHDPQLPAYASMTANVKGFGGISLLHAAVELVSTNLVKRLLALDADVEAGSTMGSPIEMAQRLHQRAEEKYEDAKKTNKQKAAIDAYHDQSTKAKKILDLLQAAKAHKDKVATSRQGNDSGASGEKKASRQVAFEVD